MSILNFLTKEQIEEEEGLRSRLGKFREERADIIHFDAEDIINRKGVDIKAEGLQNITISLGGRKKYISIFDLDVGRIFCLSDDEVERLLKDKFLHLTFKVPIPKEGE